MSVPPELLRELLELLDRECGIGVAFGRAPPGWLLARLERAAEGFRTSRAGQGNMVEFLRSNPHELERLADLVRVGETRFFRDPEQWSALERALPDLFAGCNRVRALSAGCSTGEEAWTLGMVLASARVAPFWIAGVDRSAAALEHARLASYSSDSLAHFPERFLRYVERREQALLIDPELVKRATFSQRDLLAGPPPGHYELIVCKNLLIYLTPSAASQVLRSLYGSLAAGGVMLVSRAELGRAKALGLPEYPLAPGVQALRAPV